MINLIVGLVGALVGGALAWAIEIRRRVEVTLALFSEFHTPTMLNTRHLAADKADAHPGLDFGALRVQQGRAGMQEIWAVQAFYQKLWLLMQHRQVENDLVPDLFGDRFAWWVQSHYAKRLFVLDTSQARDIEELWHWMESAAPTAQRMRWGGQM
jgi:hypothetical protein